MPHMQSQQGNLPKLNQIHEPAFEWVFVDYPVNLSEEGPNFSTYIGIPQSNGLSPVMLKLYLETVLEKIRNKISAENISYADDMDFFNKKRHKSYRKRENEIYT